MSEQATSQCNVAPLRRISELEFKRLCGEVWAESVIEPDEREDYSRYTDKESALLKAVLLRLHHRLGSGADGSSPERFEFTPDRAALYREEINRIMRQSSAASFDYNKIINRLLRELVKAETV